MNGSVANPTRLVFFRGSQFACLLSLLACVLARFGCLAWFVSLARSISDASALKKLCRSFFLGPWLGLLEASSLPPFLPPSLLRLLAYSSFPQYFVICSWVHVTPTHFVVLDVFSYTQSNPTLIFGLESKVSKIRLYEAVLLQHIHYLFACTSIVHGVSQLCLAAGTPRYPRRRASFCMED